MSGVSGSSINKTAIPELLYTVANASAFGTAIGETPLKFASNAPEQPKPKIDFKSETKLKLPLAQIPIGNTIKIDSVNVSRQPTQANMVSYYSPETVQKLLKIAPVTIYVIDNYKAKTELVGIDKRGNNIKTSHGDLTVACANAILFNKVNINKLDVSSLKEDECDPKKIKNALLYILEYEAKIQNKTSETVDLSHVAVNMSFGGGAIQNPEILKLIKTITDRGGQVFKAAGNNGYDAENSMLENTTIVDAADEIQSSRNSDNPTCSKLLKNLCSENEKRQLKPTSARVIAPQQIITRVTDDGTVEYKDFHSKTGWTPFIKAAATTSLKPIALAGFSDLPPTAILKKDQLASFYDFMTKLQKKYPNAATDSVANRDFQAELHSEAIRRFGNRAVMPLEFLGIVKGTDITSKLQNKFTVTIPNGVDPKKVYIPFERAIFETKNNTKNKDDEIERYSIEGGDIPYFTIDKNKKIQDLRQAQTKMNDGTSLSTPFALAKKVLADRVVIMNNRSK